MRSADYQVLSRVMGRIFMRLMGLTWRVRYLGPPMGRSGRVRGRNVLFAFWHGRQLPLLHTHRNEGVNVLVSRNRDGQIVTNVLHSMGFGTVRGSSSRGGREALSGMVRLLRSGRDGAITPDGPRGPAETVKAGAGMMSRLSGRPAVPMGTSGWPALRFRSWDSFLVPLPFARVCVVEGMPLRPPGRGDDPDIWNSILSKALNRCSRTADLFSSPLRRTVMKLLSATAGVVHPLIRCILHFRDPEERRERCGFPGSPPVSPVWMHGSSLGEITGLLPLADHISGMGIPVHITCFTPSGRELLRSSPYSCSYMPLDVPRCVERFLDAVRPRAVITAETEIWPNTIRTLLSRSIPCMMVNARLSRRSLRGYGILGGLAGSMLSCFSSITVRSEEDGDRFRKLGVFPDVLHVSNDIKMLSDAGPPPGEWLKILPSKEKILVAGSTRPGEEETVLRGCSLAGYLPVIAPRHLRRVEEVRKITKDLGFHPVLWSHLESGGGILPGNDAVIIDSHGILSRLYGCADAAFVGGTLAPIGGHNVLEPLMRGVPVVIGPNYGNFQRTVNDLLGDRIVNVFRESRELANVLKGLEREPVRHDIVLGSFQDCRDRMLKHYTEMIVMAGIADQNEKT